MRSKKKKKHHFEPRQNLETVSARVSPEIKKALKRRASQLGMTLSALMHELVHQAVVHEGL